MGERKLNFGAPLLSVRRFSSQSASEDRRNRKIIEHLLPDRQLSLPFYQSELDLVQVTERVTVPFHWEKIPGRAKDGSGPEPSPSEEASVTPRLPPARFMNITKLPSEKECDNTNSLWGQIVPYTSTDKECSREGINEKGGLGLEDDDDVYSDAHDTLSPTDSFSMNYSASGLSGSDGPDVKPSGTFSTDPQTLDFMMSRFLPAARAMALQPPQYASRKQGASLEQPRKVNRVASEDRWHLLNQNGSNIIPLYSQNEDEEESEDEDDEYDTSGNNSAKVCGLFPGLCFKNSLCLLSPVPVMKVGTLSHVSSTREIVRPRRTVRSQSQIVQKHAWNAVDKSQSDYRVRSGELQKVDKKRNGEYSRLTRSGDLQTLGRSSPYTRSQGAGVSPYRNEAPQSPFRSVSFLGLPKEIENLKANRFSLCNEGSNKNKQRSGPMCPAVEKTLYVDTVNNAKLAFSNSSSSVTQEWTDSAHEDVEKSLERRGSEDTTNTKSIFQDIKCLNISNKGATLDTFVSVDADISSLSAISHPKGQEVTIEDSGQNQGIDRRSSLECSKLTTVGHLNISSDQILKADGPGNADASSVSIHPPLPKSPSDSWLWRTLPILPSISSRKQEYKTSSTNTKWEAIVKSSHLHHDHVRYSEELITHIPATQNLLQRPP
ncbi:uncharacterized protein LOC122279363 [Carya illinoinensis]|uniref:uncharacterized protein LOC122279363 n=1 Tax=Carya illinoinensis TaxID=32201 RepID=UPI001C71BE84|nr:uncharacterized protein LOC122279363 [Carya illinoinensis]XP_042945922.1 uncharacterized protein LOC122279363 [Carya illinoinensis]